MKPRFNPDTLFLLFIILAGTVLRFWDFPSIPYMHDELSALRRTEFNSFSDLIAQGAKVDGHPVGVQVLLYYYTGWFGLSEPVVKFPFLVMGVLSILLAFLVARKWFNSTVGLLTAAFISFLQYTILYSQIARPYAPGLFFCLLLAWFWTNLLWGNPGKKWLNAAGYAVSGALCAYDHHFCLLFLGMAGITGLFFLRKDNRMPYLTAQLLVFILYIPHLSIFFYQLKTGGVGGTQGWLGKPDTWFLFRYLGYIFHFSVWMYLLAAGLVLYSLIVRNKDQKAAMRPRAIALIWFLVPLVTGYLYSVLVNPVIQYSVLIFSFPFLLMFMFSWFPPLKTAPKALILALTAFLSISTLVFGRKHYQIFYNQRYEQSALRTLELADSLGNDSLTVILNENPWFADFYFRKYHQKIDYQTFDQDGPDKYLNFRKFIRSCRTPYLAFGIIPPEMTGLILEEYPYIIRQDQGFTYEFLCFSRKDSAHAIHGGEVFKSRCGFDTVGNGWQADTALIRPGPLDSLDKVFLMDSLHEWGPGFSAPLHDLISGKDDIVDISVSSFFPGKPANPVLVLVLEQGGRTFFWKGIEFRDFIRKTGKFEKVRLTLRLSDLSIGAGNLTLKTYVWNKNKEVFMLGDFTIAVRKGNPRIYGLFEKI